MARRAVGVVCAGMVVLGMLLAACGASFATRPSSSTAMASSSPTTQPVPPAPLSVYYGAGIGNSGVTSFPAGSLYALSAADGSVRWRLSWRSPLLNVLSVAVAGGVVYATSFDRKLTARLAGNDGWQLWQVDTHNLISGFILAEGVIYTGSAANSQTHGYVDAYRASDGTLLWEYDGGTCSFTEIAADATGVYLNPAGCQHSLLALRVSDGSVLWHSPVTSLGGGIAVANGVVYAKHYGDIYALSTTDGRQLWHDHLANQSGQGGFVPRVANSVVYVTTDAAVYALQAGNGAQIWARLGSLMPTPSVDGTAVYLAPKMRQGSSQLNALKVSDGTPLWQITKPGQFSNPVSVNGILYVVLSPGASASAGYTVCAFRTSDGSILWQYPANDGGTTSIAVG